MRLYMYCLHSEITQRDNSIKWTFCEVGKVTSDNHPWNGAHYFWNSAPYRVAITNADINHNPFPESHGLLECSRKVHLRCDILSGNSFSLKSSMILCRAGTQSFITQTTGHSMYPIRIQTKNLRHKRHQEQTTPFLHITKPQMHLNQPLNQICKYQWRTFWFQN